MGKKCCVPGCKSGINVPSHQFPKNPERCSKWIQSLKLDYFKNYTSTQMQNYKVCHEHFRSEDYSPCLHKRVLLNIAVPVPLGIHGSINTVSNDMQSVSKQQQSRINILEYENSSLQCLNNKDMPTKKSNIDEHNAAVTEREVLMDCNVHQKASESFVPEQQDEINSVLQNYRYRLQALEVQMKTVTNTIKKRPQLQEITRCRKLSSTSRRLYEMNIKLKRRNRYLKRLVHDNKQQKKKEKVSITSSTTNTTISTAAVRENFVQMIARNKDVLPQVFSSGTNISKF